jgi:hypothetical protein
MSFVHLSSESGHRIGSQRIRYKEMREARRPIHRTATAPPHIRAKVDLAFRIDGQSVEIFEIRRHWRDESKKREHPIAKAAYNKSRRNWKVYWRMADLRWHGYAPNPEVATIENVLAVVQKDEHGCFFG